MHRRTPAKNRGADPPARFSDSTVELGNGHSDKYTKPRRVHKRSQHPIVKLIKKKPAQMANDFLNARTGVQGCFVAGVIRCTYASLYLYSIILLAIQVPTLFDPRKGLMPYTITGESDDEDDYDYSIFEFAPKSSLLMYAMFLLGITSGFFLLLGIEPRKGAIGAYFFLCNMQHHNDQIFDHEFYMSKMWAFFLILLPLDHFTIYDDFGGYFSILRKRLNLVVPQQSRRNQSTSWAMWPFRLWQVYTCMVYMGAGFAKLNTEEWTSGKALSWFWYDEGVGRLYPAFVVDLLFNRLISIKLQTWLFLLIENICFITIWPLKTRKITFAAVVLLHIGIELALVMHVFEYLSVLGWVCFFVYPNDGKSTTETLIKNKKIDGGKWTPANAFGSKKSKTIEVAVAASLLYLLIYDIFPREEAEQLMPTPLAYFAFFFVYPPAFVNTKLDALTHLIGINSGPYLLFQGKPSHLQTRMTAVIRFNDGKEPILHEDVDWSTSSFLRREINYWYDTYTYYLYEDVADPDEIPYYAALSVHLAELYGKGGINRQYDEFTIDPNNTIESVSIKVHRRGGSELPAPPGWGLFSSIPREWSYASLCQFVFTPQVVQLDYQKTVGVTLPMKQLWDNSDDVDFDIQNGCVNYNSEDEELHRQGQYGEMIFTDDGGDEEAGEQNGVEVNENGDDTPPVDQDGDDGVGNEEGEDPVIEAMNLIEENEGESVEEDDGEDEDPVIEAMRLIQENENEATDDNENEDEEPVVESIRLIQENDGEQAGDDAPVVESIRLVDDSEGESGEENEEGENGDEAENEAGGFPAENNEDEDTPEAGEGEDQDEYRGNQGDDAPSSPLNEGEDGDQDEDGGSDDDEQNHRRLRSTS